MVEGVGTGVDDGLYGVPVPLEVRGEDLDGASRHVGPDLAYGRGEDRGAPVGQLVAVHARYYGVLEAHLSGGVGDAPGFVEVELRGLAREDGAEAAGRVQTLPRIMKVAVLLFQHSPMFGQRASSQTVWRLRPRMVSFMSV